MKGAGPQQAVPSWPQLKGGQEAKAPSSSTEVCAPPAQRSLTLWSAQAASEPRLVGRRPSSRCQVALSTPPLPRRQLGSSWS